MGSSGTGGRVAAHFAHSWRPCGLDELEPMAEACQLGGGGAAGRCFNLWAAVFCRGRCAQRIGFKIHESQLLATNSRFLTSLGNSAQGSCPALYGHRVGISLPGLFSKQRQSSLEPPSHLTTTLGGRFFSLLEHLSFSSTGGKHCIQPSTIWTGPWLPRQTAPSTNPAGSWMRLFKLVGAWLLVSLRMWPWMSFFKFPASSLLPATPSNPTDAPYSSTLTLGSSTQDIIHKAN